MRFSLLALTLLAALPLRSAAEPGVTVVRTPPVTVSDDGTTVTLEDAPAVAMNGAWRAYRVLKGEIIGRTRTRYIFGNLGWAVQDDGGTAVQDWYRVDGNRLLLCPAGLPEDAPLSAIMATFDGPDAFVLDNPAVPDRPLRFQREPDQPLPLTAQRVAGLYRMTVLIPGSGEAPRESPFLVRLSADGTYRLESDPPMTAGYASGRFESDGEMLTLRPDEPDGGFWHAPVLFRLGDGLACESASAAIRLIPVPEGTVR